ncbi:MAG: single-stranded DNA-binding protein [Clostridiales bacterium]|nr:single-stranded DNA-binding protein [Clostridiales bacterium]
MNKVILVGNLTRDPELTETPSGVAVCRFSIAVSRDYASADGTRETDFFNITVWRGRAENCGKYLKKGNKVAVVGSLQTRSYEDKDGIKRNVTDIVANEVEFLTPKSAQSDSDEAPVVSAKRERPQLEAIDDNQLPF